MNNIFILGEKLHKLKPGFFNFNEGKNSLKIVSKNIKNNFKETIIFKNNKQVKKVKTNFDDQDFNFIVIENPNNYTRLFIKDIKNNSISEEKSVLIDDELVKIDNNDTFTIYKDGKTVCNSIKILDNDNFLLNLGFYDLILNKNGNLDINLKNNNNLENNIDFINAVIYIYDQIETMQDLVNKYYKAIYIIEKSETDTEKDVINYIDNNFIEKNNTLQRIKKFRR